MRFKSQSKQFWIEPVPIQNSPWNLLSVFVLRFKDSGEGQPHRGERLLAEVYREYAENLNAYL